MANYSNQTIPTFYKHIYDITHQSCKNYNGSASDLFNQLWEYFQNLINKNLFIDLVLSSSFGAYQLNINEYLLLQLTHALQINGVNFSPKVTGETSIILSKILNHDMVTLISLHNGFADGMKLLSTSLPADVTYCTIALEPYISYAITKSQFKGNLHKIPLDEYCLLGAKKAIDNHEVFFLTIDFSNKKENLFQFIDPSIFKFAALNKISLFFIKSLVNYDGSIEVRFQEKTPGQKPEEDCKEFLKYVSENNNFRRKLEIKKAHTITQVT